MADKARIPIFNWQFLLVLVLLLVAWWIYYPYSPAAVQKREMDRAERFLAPIRVQVSNDPRFKEFYAGVVTNITIHIECEVASEADFDELTHIVEVARSQASDVCPIVIRVGLDKPAQGGDYRILSKQFEAKGKIERVP